MSKKIFIVSGGTGGHIIPARCLSEHLAAQKQEVFFAKCSDIAHASPKPSDVLVPRPNSSIITKERDPADLKIEAVSSISA